MKKELNKLNKKITKNNESFREFYNRSNLPYDVAREQWNNRQDRIEKGLKIAAAVIAVIFFVIFALATIILI
jgi:formiminotetrahydrofolate cyclodeaminase